MKYFDLTGKVKTKGELEKLFGEISLPPPPKPTTKKKGEVEISVAVVKTNTPLWKRLPSIEKQVLLLIINH